MDIFCEGEYCITYDQKHLRVSFKYENCDSINLFLK